MQLDGEKGVVRHFLMDCEVRSRTRATLSSYRQRMAALLRLLREVCGVTELESVTVLHLRQCVQYLLTHPVEKGNGREPENGVGLSANTIRGYVRVWKVFFYWCCREDLIAASPAERLKPPKPEKRMKPTLSPEHVERMLEACDTSTPMGFRDYVILLLLFDTGMRLTEICSLRLADYHDTYIKVLGKGRKEREIGLHPEVSKLLWKYVNKYRKGKNADEPYLFVTVRGGRGPISKTSVGRIIKSAQQKGGLGDVQISPHVFRHTFAKLYLSRGGDLFKLSREMGHSDVSVTRIYLEDFGSTEARKEHASFSPVESIHLKKQYKRHKR